MPKARKRSSIPLLGSRTHRGSAERVAITTVNRGAINSLESRCKSPGWIREASSREDRPARRIPSPPTREMGTRAREIILDTLVADTANAKIILWSDTAYFHKMQINEIESKE